MKMKIPQSLVLLGFFTATTLAVPAPGHDDHHHPELPQYPSHPELPLVDSV
jgi:hypothetical protein